MTLIDITKIALMISNSLQTEAQEQEATDIKSSA
jgi:hypothetical protein